MQRGAMRSRQRIPNRRSRRMMKRSGNCTRERGRAGELDGGCVFGELVVEREGSLP